jgi:amidophosphoribosyltransferase
MCGIVGVVAPHPVRQALYDALTVIQHRGQDAAGIATCSKARFHMEKGNGLVRDVIGKHEMASLEGNMGIGHVRYPTAGSLARSSSQPFYVNSPFGLSIVHNGNLVNTDRLRQDIIQKDLRYLNTQSDSELLLNVCAHALGQDCPSALTADHVFKAMTEVYARVEGAYAGLLMVNHVGMIAFRDPHGIRPLVLGRREGPEGVAIMVASESIALDALGFDFVRDVAPGEVIFIREDGRYESQVCAENPVLHPCLFEYIYLARPDSVLDGVSVYRARYAMGKALAKQVQAHFPVERIDAVIPIPESSRTAGIALAKKCKLHYSEGFVKNRYIPRTFIMPEQSQRQRSVRLKLNPIQEEFKGKVVLLVDDSIVRGTTAKAIIQLARDAGAKAVYFASASPKVCYPNVYGIDMPESASLIAHGRTEAEVAALIGADGLVFNDLDDVKDAVLQQKKEAAPAFHGFEDAIFTKHYIAGQIDDAYLKRLAEQRQPKGG